MKKVYFLISLLLITSISFGQKIRFTDTSNHWNLGLRDADWNYSTATISWIGDTLVGGVNYQIAKSTSSVIYFIREDTSAGIVYYRDLLQDSVERVLYNYNLHAGDTIHFIFPYRAYTDSVASVDSIMIKGVYHKVFVLMNRPAGLGYTYIEGVGSTKGPIFPVQGTCGVEGDIHLNCFRQGTIFPAFSINYKNCFSHVSFSNSSACTDAVKNIAGTEHKISILPNPAIDKTIIASDVNWGKNTLVRIYDISGNVVYKAEPDINAKSIEINTAAMQEGLYLVLIQQDGYTTEKKLVVEK